MLGVIVLAVGIALAVVIIVLGWSARGHVAKRFEASGVTYFVPLFGAPIPLLLNPPAPNGGNGNHENTTETGNTETHENTVETVIPLNHSGQTSSLVKMTPAERAELLAVRHEAIGLLSKCVDYYQRSGQIDNGIIPRYDVLRINAEARGIIVDNLVYSGLASKVINKRSLIMPEIGTCQAALDAIVHNQVRVYPVGYHQRRQVLLESAVNALPAHQREVLP